jgi:hypothetical protein
MALAVAKPVIVALRSGAPPFSDMHFSSVRYDLKLWIGSGDVSAAYLPG